MNLLTEFEREPWAMEPVALERFLRRAALNAISGRASEYVKGDRNCGGYPADPRILVVGAGAGPAGLPNPNAEAKAYMTAQAPPRAKPMLVAGETAHIHVFGVLLKSVPAWLRFWDDEVTGYDELADDLARAMSDDKVKAIRLEVESPGGMVSGLKELADAVHAAAKTKKVTAHIEDLGASAAYWLASQADEITANPNAAVGSLGAYLTIWDLSKLFNDVGVKVHLVKSGPHKGAGVLGTQVTEEKLVPMQELIDGIAGAFHADVTRGRRRPAAETKGWMSGRVWRAEEAVGLGLVDRIVNRGTASPGGPAAATDNPHTGGSNMAMNSEELAAATKKATDEALAAERQRAKDIRAAFPDDPAFAAEQIEKGATLQEARAAYSDVVSAKLKAAQAENAKLRKGTGVAGEEPLRTGGDPREAGNADFEGAAAAYAKEHGCSMRIAMSAVARKDPALYDRYCQVQIDRAPEHAARKRAAGVK